MATYGCNEATNSAYGTSAYGTCTSQSIGAPDTGVFQELVSSGSFTLLVPLATAIVVVVITTAVMKLRHKKTATDESL
ncbi:MAG: hypothetical protein QG549_970 [Patescibacteria group bacterium]|nr:hypothetical protein [Patescibacteria group bacterium]